MARPKHFKITVVGNLAGSPAPITDETNDGYDGVRIKMGDRDRQAIYALMGVTFVPGTNAKRFVRNMAALSADPHAMWTPKQYHYLWDLVYHFRKQIHDEKLVAEGEHEHNAPNWQCLEPL